MIISRILRIILRAAQYCGSRETQQWDDLKKRRKSVLSSIFQWLGATMNFEGHFEVIPLSRLVWYLLGDHFELSALTGFAQNMVKGFAQNGPQNPPQQHATKI